MNFTGNYKSNTNRVLNVDELRRAGISVVSYNSGTWYVQGRLSEYDDWHTIGSVNQQDSAPLFFDVKAYSQIKVVSSVNATVYYKLT